MIYRDNIVDGAAVVHAPEELSILRAHTDEADSRARFTLELLGQRNPEPVEVGDRPDHNPVHST